MTDITLYHAENTATPINIAHVARDFFSGNEFQPVATVTGVVEMDAALALIRRIKKPQRHESVLRVRNTINTGQPGDVLLRIEYDKDYVKTHTHVITEKGLTQL